METNFSDYVTTETVMQAFSGAKDLAQAGAKATLQYVQAEAIATIILAALFVVAVTAAAMIVNFMARNHDRDDRLFTACITLIVWLIVTSVAISSNYQAIPTAINPAGSIIYKAIVKGGAQ